MKQNKPGAPAGASDHDPKSLSLEEALVRLQRAIGPVEGCEQMALRHALGRIAAEDITSPMDVPTHANSAMDGYAVRAADLPQSGEAALRPIGTAWAGRPFAGRVGAGDCVRIMTGALLPEGADTVLMQEHVQAAETGVRVGPGHRAGEHVRHAGEDVARGQVVVRAGTRLGAADIGLLASLGIGEVPVRRRVRVAFFSTGDELRGIGEALAPGQIYDSNRYTLDALLRPLGVEVMDMGVVRDEPDAVRRAFEDAAEVADALLTSGGVSVGEADYVKDTLAALGQVDFWKIALKPGRPFAFGRLGQAYFFGLPGNPVSVMATFLQLVRPALAHLAGERWDPPPLLEAACSAPLKKRPGRMDFQRGILERDARGRLQVRPTGLQGSHVLSSMSRANCFIVLPAEWGDVEAGTPVRVQPFHGLFC